ncbi:MAG TPA: PRC-barrel domain-containing protein [Phycisphaerales bacterium]|nr:PRC-barrel domain-containing protein [Phycisphaerales bacterium]
MNTRILSATAVLALVAGTAMAQITRPREDRRGEQVQPDVRVETRRDVIGQRAQARHELVPVDWVVGTRVIGQDRERLGDVSDLIIDAQRGRVIYGILEHGGMLGMGDRHVAIPWRTFDWDHMNRVLTLPISTDRLASAPRFDRDDWERLTDVNFRSRFDDFFGRQGFNDGKADAQFTKYVQQSRPITVRGTITDVDAFEPMTGMGQYRVLRVQTDDNKDRSVVVGPQWFVDRQRQLFQRGQQVQINGALLDLEGTRELVAAKSINTPQGSIRLRDDDGKAVWDLASDFREERQEERREENMRDRERERQDDRDFERRDREDNRGRGILDAKRETRGMIIRARDIRGQRVTDDQNNDIGRVDTFLINPANGKLGYAVITVGGFLGVGDEKYAVPWRSFQINQQGKLIAKVDREQLRNAPRIETRNWSELQDPEFGKRVFQHYGAPIDWDKDEDWQRDDRNDNWRDNRNDRDRTDRGNRNDDRLGQWDEDTFTRLFADGASTDFEGRIVRIDRAGQGGVVDVVVRTDAGERVVKLLPQAQVDNAILNLDEGDRVSVSGRHANMDGRRVIIAREIAAEGRTYQLRDEHGRPEVRVRR